MLKAFVTCSYSFQGICYKIVRMSEYSLMVKYSLVWWRTSILYNIIEVICVKTGSLSCQSFFYYYLSNILIRKYFKSISDIKNPVRILWHTNHENNTGIIKPRPGQIFHVQIYHQQYGIWRRKLTITCSQSTSKLAEYPGRTGASTRNWYYGTMCIHLFWIIQELPAVIWWFKKGHIWWKESLKRPNEYSL